MERPQAQKQSSNFYDELQRRTDIPANYALLVLAGTLIIVYYNFLEFYLTYGVTSILSFYWTLKSFESYEEGDNMQWSTFWGIFLVNFLFDYLVPPHILKFKLYYFSKLLFFSWLMLPATKGALYLYRKIFYKLPINFTGIYKLSNKIKFKFNELVDYALMNEHQNKKPEIKNFVEEPIEENLENRPPIDLNEENYYTPHKQDEHKPLNFTEKEVQNERAQEESHESRQNIVDNAKINTDNLKTSLQNLNENFSQNLDDLKDIRSSLSNENAHAKSKHKKKVHKSESENQLAGQEKMKIQ